MLAERRHRRAGRVAVAGDRGLPTPVKGHRERQALPVDWVKATRSGAGVVLTISAGKRVRTFRLTAEQVTELSSLLEATRGR